MAGGVDLSGDMIEEILSYLPVKSLLRFKSVSKSWYATISDAYFAGAHIRRQRQRKNSHRFLVRVNGYGNHHPLLIEFNKDWQVQESLLLHDHRLEIPNEFRYKAVCYGDGLTVGCDVRYLFSNPIEGEGDFVYAIWNTSTWSLFKFKCPYNSMMKYKDGEPSYNDHRLFGLGYDSLTNEYKFVICNGVQYAIFYCRNKCWSEVKNIEEFTFMKNVAFLYTKYSYHHGFFSKSNGDFYWYFISVLPIGTSCYNVVCFDPREEKIKRLPDPPCARPKGDDHVKFFPRFVPSMEDNLAFFYNCEKKILALKSGDGGEYSWTTLMDAMPKLPNGYIKMSPMYLAMKDEIIIFLAYREKENNDAGFRSCLLVYNKREQTFFESHNDLGIPYPDCSNHPGLLIPCIENLFLSSPENEGRGIEECIL